jgi:hypothetical protein
MVIKNCEANTANLKLTAMGRGFILLVWQHSTITLQVLAKSLLG